MKKALAVVIIVGLILFNFRAFLPIKKLMKLKYLRSKIAVVEDPSITWETNYKKALIKAQKENKCLVLYFTGSDWCPWCVKMKEEIFDSSKFAEKTSTYFVFCMIDFPTRSYLSMEEERQNKTLQEKYQIEGFPTLILLDTKGMMISKMGYLPIQGGQYAEEMIAKLNDYDKLEKSSLEALSAKELKKLYETAKTLGCSYYVDKIFSYGMKKKENFDFLMEKYQSELKKNVLSAMDIRKEIEASDPNNIHKRHLQLAIVDFHHLAKQNILPLEAIKPLIVYIQQFKEKDHESIWRLEMMIFHFLSLKGENEKALDHARCAYKTAPNAIKREIADAIVQLKKKLEKS